MNNHKTEVAGFFSIINGFNIIHEFETLGFANMIGRCVKLHTFRWARIVRYQLKILSVIKILICLFNVF